MNIVSTLIRMHHSDSLYKSMVKEILAFSFFTHWISVSNVFQYFYLHAISFTLHSPYNLACSVNFYSVFSCVTRWQNSIITAVFKLLYNYIQNRKLFFIVLLKENLLSEYKLLNDNILLILVHGFH